MLGKDLGQMKNDYGNAKIIKAFFPQPKTKLCIVWDAEDDYGIDMRINMKGFQKKKCNEILVKFYNEDSLEYTVVTLHLFRDLTVNCICQLDEFITIISSLFFLCFTIWRVFKVFHNIIISLNIFSFINLKLSSCLSEFSFQFFICFVFVFNSKGIKLCCICNVFSNRFNNSWVE